jgi:hypothetical protein
MSVGLIAQEIGQLDGSMRFMTGDGEWKVVAWNGRFALCKFTNERMRITADGSLLYGASLQTPDNALEVYWFNTREWCELARRRMIAIDRIPYDIKMRMITPLSFSNGTVGPSYKFEMGPELSDWQCYLFGSRQWSEGITYRPKAGHVPNFFVRWCMKVMLACTWVKDKA